VLPIRQMRLVTALKDLSRPHDGVPPIPNGLHGYAVVERVTRTGMTREGNPEVELVLTVAVAGRERYPATIRRVLSRHVLHNLGPGHEVSVTVDPHDPARLEIG
jgi:hypothetical protein